jgi:hypothetical protein
MITRELRNLAQKFRLAACGTASGFALQGFALVRDAGLRIAARCPSSELYEAMQNAEASQRRKVGLRPLKFQA